MLNDKKYLSLQFIAVLWAVLLIFLPLIVVVYNSFFPVNEFGFPVYENLTFNNYTAIWGHGNVGTYKVVYRTLYLSFLSTIACVIIGYPLAYYGATFENIKAKKTFIPWNVDVIYLLLSLPLFVNFLIRLGAIRLIFKNNGIVHSVFSFLGFVENDTYLIGSNAILIIGMFFGSLFFFIQPVYFVTRESYLKYKNPGQDLYLNKWNLFKKVILPNSYSSIIAGVLIAFITSSSDFLTPYILNSQNNLISTLIHYKFFDGKNWGEGSALAVGVLITYLILIYLVFKILKNKPVFH